MKLSIIIPVMNEQGNITALVQRLQAATRTITSDLEILFVDDGSEDGTFAEVAALHKADPRIKLLSFSRNFGHQIALTAGMDFAEGDAVIVMDGDLQHPPELIQELVRRWQDGFEIVYTVRNSSSGDWFKKGTAGCFYRVFRWLTGVDLPMHAADFRLLDRKVIRAFQNIRERNRFLRGLTQWVGFRHTAVPYEEQSRQAGTTKYGFQRMAGLALDALVSFSLTPLYMAIYLGLALAFLGFVYALYAIYSRFITHHVLPGWTSLLVLICLVGGIQLLVTGIIGLYLGKVYEEVKQRPLYLIRDSLGFENLPAGRKA